MVQIPAAGLALMNTEDYIRKQQDGYRRDAIRLAEYRRREEERRCNSDQVSSVKGSRAGAS